MSWFSFDLARLQRPIIARRLRMLAWHSIGTSGPEELSAIGRIAMHDGLIALLLLVGLQSIAHAQVPAAIAAPGESAVATWHAEGAQIYECKAGADGKLAWVFREPIATLLLDGKTIGRHYAGPNWEHMDGSAVVGKVAANAPGATPNDIPLLKLDVVSSRGSGALSGVTTVQRINTLGGRHEGACEKAGTFHSAPYAAEYVFLKK
jgi:hypothetical protein